jgi:hypothetical protein
VYVLGGVPKDETVALDQVGISLKPLLFQSNAIKIYIFIFEFKLSKFQINVAPRHKSRRRCGVEWSRREKVTQTMLVRSIATKPKIEFSIDFYQPQEETLEIIKTSHKRDAV